MQLWRGWAAPDYSALTTLSDQVADLTVDTEGYVVPNRTQPQQEVVEQGLNWKKVCFAMQNS